MPKRAVAIGDLHGDLNAARAALRTAGAIDANDKWIGGDLAIIQTGDILDRGDGESQILDLFAKLATDAHESGGQVIQLLGNHELMNAAHDFRYVTPGGKRDFDGDREHELGPGGTWAKRLATHNVIAIVGDTVLSHAGVTAEWATHLDEVNEHARCWLDGQEGGADSPTLALTADDSPVWTRVSGPTRSTAPSSPTCSRSSARSGWSSRTRRRRPASRRRATARCGGSTSGSRATTAGRSRCSSSAIRRRS